MAFTFRRQPFRAFYFFTNLTLLLFIRLPFWSLLYVLPSLRPRKTWSWKRSIIVQALRAFIDTLYATALPAAPVPDESTARKDGLVWVDATPELVVGEVKQFAETNAVEAVKVAGYWYGARDADGQVGQKATPGEKVVYHLHGGGFVIGTAHPSGLTRPAFDGFIEHFPSHPRVFALEYRLSSTSPFTPSNPFPAALIDAIAGYNYLVTTLGFAPSDVLVSGDSAGGLLAIWLARYLATAQLEKLPQAGALLLHSPTVDFANTHVGPNSSMVRNARTDYVHSFIDTKYTYRALLGTLPESDAVRTWLTPASKSLPPSSLLGAFSGFPKTAIVVGGAEQTLDGVVAFRGLLETDVGAQNVWYVEARDATHDFLTLGWHEPERTEVFREVGGWLGKEVWGEGEA
ncbi:alpha/beta-hydrolase [Trametopsis cervina]|nr:alpha/beta-hydrolase [Trametopsis cervina]